MNTEASADRCETCRFQPGSPVDHFMHCLLLIPAVEPGARQIDRPLNSRRDAEALFLCNSSLSMLVRDKTWGLPKSGCLNATLENCSWQPRGFSCS